LITANKIEKEERERERGDTFVGTSGGKDERLRRSLSSSLCV
jgi:hypothetical protein